LLGALIGSENYDRFHRSPALADKKGGPHARNYKGYRSPYTGAEHAWLEAVLKKLIRRAAQVAYDPKANRPLISMATPTCRACDVST
jgi:hypothetical protein